MTKPAALETLRVDHVGSLARPQALLAAHAALDRDEMSEEEVCRIEDEAIQGVIARQETIGFPVVNDGEFRRRNFQDSFGASVSGFDVPQNAVSYYHRCEEDKPTRQGWVESGPSVPGPAVVTRRVAVQRLKLVRNLPLEEYRFAAGIAHRPVKVTLIGPDRIAQRFDYQSSRGVYEGLDDFTSHVAQIQRQMVTELVGEGCQYIQIDAPSYTAYVDPPSLEAMRSRGENPDRNLERSIDADNAVIQGFSGVTFGIHICRGNSRAKDPNTGRLVPQWHREGHYDAIAERLFSRLNHKRFLLEYDSERAGSFEPLRFVPSDRVVVLGLLSTKSEEVESVDLLLRRIEQAARYIPLERLALSPQCGFGSTAADSLPEEVQWRKLEAVLETAARVWP